MPHAPVQVHVRLKNNFALPINTEPTSASAILLCNHRIFFEDVKKALELFMDVAHTKPKHKALGTKGKGKLQFRYGTGEL